MGWFDWLWGGGEERAEQDRIYLTDDARWRNLQRHVEERLSAADRPDALLLVGHFPHCQQQLQPIADRCAAAGGTVMATTVEALQQSDGTAIRFDESQRVEIVAAERHPLPERDAQITQFAAELPCQTRVTHFLSLDDPVLRVFAGEWVENILRRLGMDEDEGINSPMVSHRLRSAQQKVAAQAIADAPAESAEQWFEKNCPKIWNNLA